ncbi:Conserved_hypothetical protein [Hexamita inflata]|uniref:Uncharacterized protein n=1 Tax=Hexamita inflata TaxID=28002 RepID=A0AA86REJ9_9EUKA|nr:Conserved hypothetical protein [Hexamita inflata]
MAQLGQIQMESINTQSQLASNLVNANFMTVNKSIADQENNKKLRNIARQMRAEGPASFTMLRDQMFPPTDEYEPFKLLYLLPVDVRRQFGQQIFDRICNYLRLLAAKGFFPRGKLEQQIIVRLILENENDPLSTVVGIESIQLVPKYLSRQPQRLEQLTFLRDFLFAETFMPESGNLVDFYFQPATMNFYDPHDLNQVAILVQSADEINLQLTPGMIFVTGAQVMTTQQIFEAKHTTFEKNHADLWIILARFCNEHTALQRLEYLPRWLNDYVKYDHPLELPHEFTNNVNCVAPIENLRIVLGIYPTPVQFKPQIFIDESILEAAQNLEIWFQQKFYQMIYLCHQFKLGPMKNEGVIMQCEVATLLQLIRSYE